MPPGPGIMAPGASNAVPTPSSLLCPSLSSSICPRSLHTGFLGVFSYIVVHSTNSSKIHITALDALTSRDRLHVCLSLPRPLCLPLWFLLPALPNQSTVAGGSTTHPAHSLARRCKASGIRRRWESPRSQGGQERGRVCTRAVDAIPLRPPPRALGQNAPLQCGHQPSQLEECLHSPFLQFHSACSRTDDNRDGTYGPQSHRAFWESDTELPQAWWEGPRLLSTASPLFFTRALLLSLLKRKCTHSDLRKNSLNPGSDLGRQV